jgi:hypothetical protein
LQPTNIVIGSITPCAATMLNDSIAVVLVAARLAARIC